MTGWAGAISFLSVSDLGQSAAFYDGVLGLRLVVDQGDCRIYRVSDSAFVGLCERPHQMPTMGHILTLVTEDVDGAHHRLESAGVTVDSPPAHSARYGIYRAFYRDPDGNRIEVQRFDDPGWAR